MNLIRIDLNDYRNLKRIVIDNGRRWRIGGIHKHHQQIQCTKSLEFQGKKRQLLLSRKSMHLIRIDFIDKKYTLISTIEIKNALELMMGGVGEGGGGGGEEIRISPH